MKNAMGESADFVFILLIFIFYIFVGQKNVKSSSEEKA